MKVGSTEYGGDKISHGQVAVYDNAKVAGQVENV